MNERVSILDLWVDAVDIEQALARVAAYIDHGNRPHSIFAVNPEKCFSVPGKPELHRAFARADLLIPDGIGVVLAARWLHGVQLARVPGVDLMERICRLAADRGYGIFLYGAREEVNRAAAANLRQRYPNLAIAGRSHGYVPAEDMPDLIDRINDSRARILFLALGSPRQERWFCDHAQQLEAVRVCQGVGGSLDVVAGTVERAPAAWCSLGLEWLYRLLKEPRRIGRQKVLPLFALQVLASRYGARRLSS